VRGFALDTCIAEDTRFASLGNPITSNKADRDTLYLGPGLDRLGGIAFGWKNDLIGKTPGLDNGINILTTNIATNSENS